MPVARYEIIPNFKIFEPTYNRDGSPLTVRDENQRRIYDCQLIRDDDFYHTESNHFPIILNSDGSPWTEGCLYLLDKLKAIKTPSPKTLESNASDLTTFRRWLDREEIDYLNFPRRIMARPTYRYSGYLREEINRGNIQYNTAKRKMSTVQLFYRWLKDIRNYEFEYPLWREKEVFISLKDEVGRSFSKKQITTDIGFKQVNKNSKHDHCIEDGGHLRPLTRQEQHDLIKALVDIGNTEMTLSFLLALTCGGRIQSIFTMRRHHFSQQIHPEQTHVRFKIGIGTDIDSKYGKNNILYIPRWLYQKVAVYLQSERSIRRLRLSKNIFENDDKQYAFLTKSGAPYYLAKNDPFSSSYRNPPRGISINAFIRQQLMPLLNSRNRYFSFRFHDLRASFGLNYLEEQLSNVPESSTEFWPALLSVKKRMGHSSIHTTENYLNYKNRTNRTVILQSEFEEHLMGIDVV